MFDSKTRLLVVDDMLTMRKLVVKVCKELGFTDISETEDGAKAWAAVQEARPLKDKIEAVHKKIGGK